MTQTFRTANFLNLLGVNTHLYVTSSRNWDGGAVLDDLKYLGISHIRDETLIATNQGQGSYALLAANGIKFDLIVPGSTNIPTDIAQINGFLSAHPGSISAIEGPNEIDMTPVTYGGLTGTAAAVLFQSNLYSAVKGDAALSGAAIYNFTDGNVAGQADYANIHVYPSQGAQPYATLAHLLQVQQGIMAKPAVVTEAGYSTANTSSGLGGVDGATQAKLTLNMLMDATKLGVGELFLYQLFDDNDPSNTNLQAHYGLFDSTGAAKPVAVALHNLTSILADAGSTASTFATGTLNYTLTGAPTGSSSLLMEKSSGVYEIVLWNEPQIWNATTRTEVAAAATQTTINLGATYGTVDVYDPLVGTTAISEVHNVSSVKVALTDHPLVIQVSSASSVPAVVNAALGTSAPDVLYGGPAGHQVLDDSVGAHTLDSFGGANDTFLVSHSDDVVIATAGSPNFVSASVSFTTPANVGILTFTGSANVTGTGDGAGDIVVGNAGTDILNAAATGTDTLDGGSGPTKMYGGAGTTYFNAGTGVVTMYGGTGANTYTINNTADVVVAKAGAVLNNLYSSVSYTAPANVKYMAFTGSANVTGRGNGAGDALVANSGADILYAAATGTDNLRGGAGHATMYGGAGTTFFVAGVGADTMYGGTGSNTFTINNTADVVVAEAGAVMNHLYSSVSYTAPANVTYMAFTGSVAVTGTANNGVMTMVANSGGDTLIGGAGKATLLGGAGNDTLVPGTGGGLLTGGGGADTFVFSSIASTGALKSPTTITDFSSASHDHIDLRTLEANVLGANHSFHFIGAAAFSHTAGELHYAVNSSGLTLSGDINGDGVADFSILLSHVTSLSATDLIL
jgi:Ca2+-binding RTX toxin-like protein